MAIDTTEKRRAVSGIGGVPLIPGVTPNASKDVGWRQQAGWSYSGVEVVLIAAKFVSCIVELSRRISKCEVLNTHISNLIEIEFTRKMTECSITNTCLSDVVETEPTRLADVELDPYE